MKALFIGGKLHGQERDDPRSPRYEYKEVTRKKVSYRGGGWSPAEYERQVYVRHETLPVYRLEGYAPTPDDLELVDGWLVGFS